MKEFIVEGHNTTEHDGGVALMEVESSTKPLALASERVSRQKHDGNSQIAYDYLRSRSRNAENIFGGHKDLFNPVYTEYQDLHHHLAHAASAFYPSGFSEAGVLVIDGQGALTRPNICASSSIWKGQNNDLQLLEVNSEPDIATQSIGHLYASVSFYLGFGFLQEGKVMGLAAYGEMSDIYKLFKKYIHSEPGGQYHIHPKLIRAMLYLTEGRKFFHLEDSIPGPESRDVMEDISSQLGSPREHNGVITQRDKNLAWAVQHISEELILGLAQRTRTLTGSDKLCYSGGVALNSVANGKLQETGLFKDIFIIPAAGDEGQAVGRLFYRAHHDYDYPRQYVMKDAYLGPEYSETEIVDALQQNKDKLKFCRLEDDDLIDRAVDCLANGKIVGWYQGGSEIGPRALGHRSILADPRGADTRDYINFKIKHREWFRPLAPSVHREAVKDFFDKEVDSPYMLVAVKIKADKLDKIPAISHVDGTARLQTVTKEDNGLYYDLIQGFSDKTGIPILLNTSFNDAGEPIVETPLDAVRSLLKMNFNNLVIGNYFVEKV